MRQCVGVGVRACVCVCVCFQSALAFPIVRQFWNSINTFYNSRLLRYTSSYSEPELTEALTCCTATPRWLAFLRLIHSGDGSQINPRSGLGKSGISVNGGLENGRGEKQRGHGVTQHGGLGQHHRGAAGEKTKNTREDPLKAATVLVTRLETNQKVFSSPHVRARRETNTRHKV